MINLVVLIIVPLTGRARSELDHSSTRGDQDARSEPRFGRRSVNAPIHSLHPASDRLSIGRRIFRSLTRFSIAVLIGVGATLAWQSDSARQMVVARTPTLAWLLSISSPVVAAPPPEQVQQIEFLATNLYIVRRSLERLIAKQEQMNLSGADLCTADAVHRSASNSCALDVVLSGPGRKVIE